jgi:hypothetical protein
MTEITALVRRCYGGIGGDGQTVEIDETHFAAAQKWAQIVDAVAAFDPIVGGAEGTPIACVACRAMKPGRIFGDHPFEHKDDCWWVAARRLAGKEA